MRTDKRGPFKLRSVLLITSFFYTIAPCDPTYASHWGADTLASDAAADLLAEIAAGRGIGTVRSALQEAAVSSLRLEDDMASRALAAAELVAAMLGHPSPTLQLRFQEWASIQARRADADLATLAQIAQNLVNRVAWYSESTELMQDSPDERLWKANLDNLRARLSAQ